MNRLDEAINHIKTRADAWAVKEVTEALRSISERLEKSLSQEPCDYAISRKAVIEILTKYNLEMSKIAEDVNELPSVTQKGGVKNV